VLIKALSSQTPKICNTSIAPLLWTYLKGFPNVDPFELQWFSSEGSSKKGTSAVKRMRIGQHGLHK